MKKLTAEKCRKQIETWEWRAAAGIVASSTELHLEAYKIALPILERQESGEQGSVIAEQLEAVRDSLALTPHQNAIIGCAIDRINLLTKRTLDLSRELTEQPESEGATSEWIQHACTE